MIRLCIASLAIALSLAACNRSTLPPLPDAVKQIQCKPNPRNMVQGQPPPIVADGYDVVRIEKKVIAAPCSRPGRFRGAEVSWGKAKDPHDRPIDSVIVFNRLIEGGFEIDGPHASMGPDTNEPWRYGFRASVSPTDYGPLSDTSPNQFEVTVPTPPQFADTGPETRFLCTGKPRYPLSCYARARAGATHWTLTLWARRVWQDDWDIADDVAEAYALAAAHIIQ
jgi:hypothetical protein